MATLKYIGTPPQFDIQPGFGGDPSILSYLNLLLAQNMTMPQVTTQINAALTPYAPASYATSAMSGLATPTYLNTQVANYVHTTTVNQPNGPAALGAASGQIAKGQIAAASTQQWPSPFWSPSSYQLTGQTWPIKATTTPQNLYTIAIPYPGYTYVLACFGSQDCQVATDNGAFPQVLVRLGSTTGTIIAFGYGLGEFYLGPSPGTISSQAFLNGSSTLTSSWVTIPGWTANNSGGFTTTMLGNFLSIPNTTNATLSASVTFAGADGGGILNTPSTVIRIVNNAGTVLATGTAVSGGSGTCTVSFTGALTAGQLYTVQAEETGISAGVFGVGAGTYGSISSGTLTLTPGQIPNTAMVDIIPVPFEDQTHQTGPVTLYVMLQSSDSTTQVSATQFDPSMWVCPIPWA